MIITVFFTFQTSLSDWKKLGIIERELLLYKDLHTKYKIKFNLITYGDKEDVTIGEKYNFINIYPIYSTKRNYKSKIINLFKSLLSLYNYREVLIRSDIFKSNQTNGIWLPLIASILFKKKLLFRCGYIWLNFLNLRKSKYIKKVFVKILTVISAKKANKIIVTNLKDKIYLSDLLKIDNNKINVVPNYVNTNIFKSNGKYKKKDLLFIGRPTKQKNLFLLLKSLINLRYNLTVVGENNYNKKVYEFIKLNNLNVNFIGIIKNSELADLYRSHKLYIICSSFEGSPKTLLEAMSCGTVVIGTNVEGINNIINDRVNGFLINQNSHELHEKIKELMSNNEIRSKISINAEDMIMKNYSLNVASTKEFNVYKKILDS